MLHKASRIHGAPVNAIDGEVGREVKHRPSFDSIDVAPGEGPRVWIV